MQRLWALVSGLDLDDPDDDLEPGAPDSPGARPPAGGGHPAPPSVETEELRHLRHCVLLLQRFADAGLDGVDTLPEFATPADAASRDRDRDPDLAPDPAPAPALPRAATGLGGSPGDHSSRRRRAPGRIDAGDGSVAIVAEAEVYNGKLVDGGRGSVVTTSSTSLTDASDGAALARGMDIATVGSGISMAHSPSELSSMSVSASGASAGGPRAPGRSDSGRRLDPGTEGNAVGNTDETEAAQLASSEFTEASSIAGTCAPVRHDTVIESGRASGSDNDLVARQNAGGDFSESSRTVGSDTPIYRTQISSPVESIRAAKSSAERKRDAFERLTNTLGTFAELLVRGDQENSALWDVFLEYRCMELLLRCLERTVPRERTARLSTNSSSDCLRHAEESAAGTDSVQREGNLNAQPQPDVQLEQMRYSQTGIARSTSDVGVTNFQGAATGRETEPLLAARFQAEVLRSVAILVHSVRRRESLYAMFSADHINSLLSFEFNFSDEEVLLFYMSAAKSIGTSLDESLLQLFFDSRSESFPLYTISGKFASHRDRMVRIAVRNLTLTIFSMRSTALLRYIVQDSCGYLASMVHRLCTICGEVARAFEFILDDGREVRRTVSRRMGRFRQKIRMPQVHAGLDELSDIVEYLNDVTETADRALVDHVVRMVCSKCFGPFFRPIASQAAPEAVALAKKRWGFRSLSDADVPKLQPAISLLDASARGIVLGFICCRVTNCRFGIGLLEEMSQPSLRFERRTALHGLRAIAADLSGKERSTHIAVCALEAIARLECCSTPVLKSCGLSLDVDNDENIESDIARTTGYPQVSGELTSYVSPSIDYSTEHHSNLKTGSTSLSRPGSATCSRSSEAGKSFDGGASMVLSLGDFAAPLTPTTPVTPNSSSQSMFESFSSDTAAWDKLEGSSQTMSHAHNRADSARLSESGQDEASPDEEGILSSFRRGEASLREIVSSILLVVRTHEVRTARVAQAVCRLMCGVGLRSGNWGASVDVAKVALDEMASMVIEFLKDERTTIVAIESCFDNFVSAARPESEACSQIPDLSYVLGVDTVHLLATDLPPGSGRRRRSAALGNSFVQPTDPEDARTFFVLIRAYERMLTEVVVARGISATAPNLNAETSLHKILSNILEDEDSSGTYLDKKDALQRVARETMKYNLRTRLGLVGVDALL